MTAPEDKPIWALRSHICEPQDDHDGYHSAAEVALWDDEQVAWIHRCLHARYGYDRAPMHRTRIGPPLTRVY